MTTYRGFRVNGDARVEVLTEDGLCDPLPHVMRHSPDGFEWGYGGSGPADLALSILEHAGIDTGLYQDFKWEFIAHLPSGPNDDWELDQAEVTSWARRKVMKVV